MEIYRLLAWSELGLQWADLEILRSDHPNPGTEQTWRQCEHLSDQSFLFQQPLLLYPLDLQQLCACFVCFFLCVCSPWRMVIVVRVMMNVLYCIRALGMSAPLLTTFTSPITHFTLTRLLFCRYEMLNCCIIISLISAMHWSLESAAATAPASFIWVRQLRL